MTRDQARPVAFLQPLHARPATARWQVRHGWAAPNWPLREALVARLEHAATTGRDAARLYGPELAEVRPWLGDAPVRHWPRKPQTLRAARNARLRALRS